MHELSYTNTALQNLIKCWYQNQIHESVVKSADIYTIPINTYIHLSYMHWGYHNIILKNSKKSAYSSQNQCNELIRLTHMTISFARDNVCSSIWLGCLKEQGQGKPKPDYSISTKNKKEKSCQIQLTSAYSSRTWWQSYFLFAQLTPQRTYVSKDSNMSVPAK